jgi:hypothetical protein
MVYPTLYDADILTDRMLLRLSRADLRLYLFLMGVQTIQALTQVFLLRAGLSVGNGRIGMRLLTMGLRRFRQAIGG